MNICVFSGNLAEDPVLDKNNGVSFLDLCILVYNYRTTKSTKETSKTPVYLYFEAWAGGAEAIAKNFKKGDMITVYATAKNINESDDRVIFRINEFE